MRTIYEMAKTFYMYEYLLSEQSGLRKFYPSEVVAMIHYNGLTYDEIVESFGEPQYYIKEYLLKED